MKRLISTVIACTAFSVSIGSAQQPVPAPIPVPVPTLFKDRLEATWIVKFTNGDDGFSLYFEGIEFGRDRGTAGGYPDDRHRYNLYQIVKDNYYAALKNHHPDNQASTTEFARWSRIVERILLGEALEIKIECWNAGGPSQVTYRIDTDSPSGGLSSNRYVGSNAKGASCVQTYQICYDRLTEIDVLSKNNRLCPARLNPAGVSDVGQPE